MKFAETDCLYKKELRSFCTGEFSEFALYPLQMRIAGTFVPVRIGCGYMKKIKHCKKCKDGRLVALKPRGLMFCGFCGAEYSSKF
jgi:hypothetical protein